MNVKNLTAIAFVIASGISLAACPSGYAQAPHASLAGTYTSPTSPYNGSVDVGACAGNGNARSRQTSDSFCNHQNAGTYQ